MELIKTYSGGVQQSGDVMTFLLQYYNTGTKTAIGPITVIDYLPSVFDYVEGSSQAFSGDGGVLSFVDNAEPTVVQTTTGTIITWNVDADVVYHASGWIQFDAMLNTKLTGGTTVINSGRIVAFDPEPNTQNNTNSVTIRVIDSPDVWIQKEILVPGSGAYGNPVSFALNFGNNGVAGSGDATGVYITDMLPTGFDFNNANDCVTQIATVHTSPGIPSRTTYDPYPGAPSCTFISA